MVFSSSETLYDNFGYSAIYTTEIFRHDILVTKIVNERKYAKTKKHQAIISARNKLANIAFFRFFCLSFSILFYVSKAKNLLT